MDGVVKVRRKGVRNRWKKAFVVLDGAILKRFRNDQEIQPKSSFDLQECEVCVRNKKACFFVSVRPTEGNPLVMKMKECAVRDAWAQALNNAKAEAKEAELRKQRLQSLKTQLSKLHEKCMKSCGMSLCINIDWLSLELWDGDAHRVGCEWIASGSFCEYVGTILHSIKRESEGEQKHEVLCEPLEILVLHAAANPSLRSFYDKASKTLHLLGAVVDGSVRLTPASTLRLALTTTGWACDMERRIQTQFRSHTESITLLLGTDAFQFYLSAGQLSARSEAQGYFSHHVQGPLGDLVVTAVREACHAFRTLDAQLPRPRSGLLLPARICRELSETGSIVRQDSTEDGRASNSPRPIMFYELRQCLGSVTIVVVPKDVTSDTPPLLEARPRGEGTFSPAASVRGSVRRRRQLSLRLGDSNSRLWHSETLADAVICRCLPRDLASELRRAFLRTACLNAALATDSQLMDFGQTLGLSAAVDWASFKGAVEATSCDMETWFHLALELGSSYRSRLTAISQALTERRAVRVSKVVVAFTPTPASTPCNVQARTLHDFGWIAGHSLQFSPDPHGDVCRALPASTVVEQSSSTSDGSESGCSDESDEEPVDTQGPRLSKAPTRKEATVDALKGMASVWKTCGDDATLAAKYPFDDLHHTATTLQAAFQPATVGLREVGAVVCEGLQRLRHIFRGLDCGDGTVESSSLQNLLAAFRQFPAKDDQNQLLIREITSRHRGQTKIPWGTVADTVMSKVLPQDVRASIDCKREVIMVGLANSGKTLILNALKHRQGERTYPTIGAQTEQVAFKTVNFSITELGGSGQQPKSWLLHTKHTNNTINVRGLILCVDGAHRANVEASKKPFKRLLLAKHLKRKPVALLINNCRSQACMTTEQIVAILKLPKYCQESKREYSCHRCHVCSPADGDVLPQLLAMLDWLYGKV